MDECDRNRALANGGRYALDVATSHVADSKNAGTTRFEKIT
jgi:hypothetical protein